MAFQTPITIKEAIANIYKKNYLLPSIQREVVWDTERIQRLFDSLMRDYYIGSLLYWHVKKHKSNEYQFYEFVRDYHEKNSKHNPKANISGEDDITAILDGQQRLTALYIGLRGTYAEKLPKKRWDNPSAYPQKALYLNLLSKSDDFDMAYDFHFLTKEEARYRDENTFWFKVGDILDIDKEYAVNKYLIKHKLLSLDEQKAQFANETLFKLHTIIHKNPIINYYLEKDEDLDKVLQEFIRVNSGGIPLSYSDLLLSIATAQWQKKDAREEINGFVDEINKIGDGFNFDKDFVLKTCLVLCDFTDIAFKVGNFNKSNMLTIEKDWDDIAESIILAVKLASGYGYNRDTLISNYTIIPIAYYILKNGLQNKSLELSKKYSRDRDNINKWMILSLLKRFFGGQPDNVLRPIREILKNNRTEFPLDKIIDKFRGDPKTLVFTDDEIDNLFSYKYGQSYTFTTLALLYPSLDYRNKFHIDHIFPKSLLTKSKLLKHGIKDDKINFYIENVNGLANLQLLEGIPNIEKSDTPFNEWFYKTYKTPEECKDYTIKHFIPDLDLCLENFEEFVIERKKKMTKQFKSILKI